MLHIHAQLLFLVNVSWQIALGDMLTLCVCACVRVCMGVCVCAVVAMFRVPALFLYSFTKMSERPRHSNKTKQNFGLTGFPNASSRASTGTNDEEAPVTLLHFGFPYRWVGLQ